MTTLSLAEIVNTARKAEKVEEKIAISRNPDRRQ